MADKKAAEISPAKLTDTQRARIERNKQKALALRKARVTTRPYSNKEKMCKPPPSQPIDTGAGFLLEEEPKPPTAPVRTVKPSATSYNGEILFCDECHKQFAESFLVRNFDVAICDACRDSEEQHKLITKTDGKSKYLLKDEDFDKREPPLKFIVRKNPHNPRWGEMKLFLESEVHKRAMEVWETEDKLEEAREQREENQHKLKQKRFDKKVKDLRLAVRSSLWTKDISAHEHTYGEETYNEDDDTYTKTCTTCSHTLTFEKM